MNYNTRLRLRALYHGLRLICAGIIGDKNRIADYIPARDIIRSIPILHRGEQHEGDIVYLINESGGGKGFFAEFKLLLGHLYFADRLGFKPCVIYGTDYLYYDSSVEKIKNPFEYYFLPIGDDIDPMQASNIVLCDELYGCNIDYIDKNLTDNYHISDRVEDIMASMVKKYIKIRPELLDEFNKEYDRLLGLGHEKVLGIHFRGTDFKMNYKRHPISIGLDSYLNKAEELLKANEFQKIFLATDDQEAYERFKSAFGSKMISFTDTLRSSEKISVAFSQNARQMHHYMLGLEVLKDMYFLSSCDGILCGVSQVSNIAKVFKKSRGESYQYLKVLDKGINDKGKDFLEFLNGYNMCRE